MKIIVFSDSHGVVNNMVSAVNKHKDADMIIHLGDVVKDAQKLKEIYSHIPVEFVSGNNDWARENSSEKVLELEGIKIFITHGHNYGVKISYDRLIQKAEDLGADAVLFGHTHRTEELYHDGILVLNPGSISLPAKPSNPTYCVIEIMNGKVKARFGGVK